ncbi:UNKNOWN [Stylonychia lemnae]|uniref:Uncharacterized protein n=1 Tax=Stylonychia lemnae TaxID=5949 RepID=A0A078ATE6_STYLE|nr:UNKNOWN [Stylonychia lemnae]|eukprot:CDW85489.1 UNKNOWN [Stylonychia lemnae]
MSSNFQTISNKFSGSAPSDDDYLLNSDDPLDSNQIFKELDLQMSSENGSCSYQGSSGQSNKQENHRIIGSQGQILENVSVNFFNENENAINQWKDSRLKKLEDFTKDLGRSSSNKRNRKEIPGSEMTTLKNQTFENKNQKDNIDNEYITLSSNMIAIQNSSQASNQIQLHQVQMNNTASVIGDYSSIVEIGNRQSEQHNSNINNQFAGNQEQYYNNDIDDDETFDDELMLTKTEGSTQMKFGSNICSTQRSMHQNMSVNGEFEKRITDIKQKLTQIKNTINNEIENSFNQQLNDNNASEYNSNQNVLSPQIMSGISSQRRLGPTSTHNIQSNNNYGQTNHFQQPNTNYNQQATNQLQQNSVISSLDNFQVKINHIKQNISQSYQNNTTVTNNTQQEELDLDKPLQTQFKIQNQFQQLSEKERFNRIKNLIDNSFNQSNSKSTHNNKLSMDISSNINHRNSSKVNTQLSQQSVMTSNIDQLSNTNEDNYQYSVTNQHRTQGSQLLNQFEQTQNSNKFISQNLSQTQLISQSMMEKENESLKQKLSLMIQTEQMLNKKMDQIYNDQQKEKQRYEEQLQKMQEEISKMCEIMQDMNKKKKRANSKKAQSKKLRIQQLEKQIKDLQYQMLNQPQMPNSNENHLIQTQTSNMSNKGYNTKQREIMHIEDQTARSIDMPINKHPNKDKQQLEKQVSQLEEKMKQFHHEMTDSNQSQQLRDQLKLAMDENQKLRTTFQKSYQEMMTSFDQFKQEMEKRMHEQQKEYDSQQAKQQQKYQEESENRAIIIEKLKTENQFLKEKIHKIKDVFDLKQISQQPYQDFNKHAYSDHHPTQSSQSDLLNIKQDENGFYHIGLATQLSDNMSQDNKENHPRHLVKDNSKKKITVQKLKKKKVTIQDPVLKQKSQIHAKRGSSASVKPSSNNVQRIQ